MGEQEGKEGEEEQGRHGFASELPDTSQLRAWALPLPPPFSPPARRQHTCSRGPSPLGSHPGSPAPGLGFPLVGRMHFSRIQASAFGFDLILRWSSPF